MWEKNFDIWLKSEQEKVAYGDFSTLFQSFWDLRAREANEI